MKRLCACLFLLAACSKSNVTPSEASKGTVDAAPLRTDWTPEQLTAACAEAEKTCDAKLAQAQLLAQGQELLRGQHTAPRMAPARQGLEPRQAAAGQPYDRLEVGGELLALQGPLSAQSPDHSIPFLLCEA